MEFLTKEVVDKSALKAAIDAAQAIVDSGVQADYSADSWKALTDNLAAAKTVYGDEKASADQVKTAVTELTEAMNGLKKLITAQSVTVGKIAESGTHRIGDYAEARSERRRHRSERGD